MDFESKFDLRPDAPRVDFRGRPAVLRVSRRSRGEFETEISVMRLLRGRVPVPEVLQADAERRTAILEFVEGEPLHRVEDRMSEGEIRRIAADLGRHLATIHSIEFPTWGFLAPGPVVGETSGEFGAAMERYVRTWLADPRIRRRLGELRVGPVEFRDLGPTNRLVHADFNTKNILVKDGAVAAILDWEFALSACPLMDFGNFFRFDDELPRGYDALPISYREAGGALPAEWRDRARRLDLLALLSFLDREEELPKTFATVRSVLARMPV